MRTERKLTYQLRISVVEITACYWCASPPIVSLFFYFFGNFSF